MRHGRFVLHEGSISSLLAHALDCVLQLVLLVLLDLCWICALGLRVAACAPTENIQTSGQRLDGEEGQKYLR